MGGVSRLRHAGAKLAPFAGVIGGLVGWAVSDQLGSSLVIDDCRRGTPLVMVAIGLGGLAVAAFGGLVAHRIWRRGAASEGRRFVALIGMGVAAALALAILYQTVGTLIIPRCLG